MHKAVGWASQHYWQCTISSEGTTNDVDRSLFWLEEAVARASGQHIVRCT